MAKNLFEHDAFLLDLVPMNMGGAVDRCLE